MDAFRGWHCSYCIFFISWGIFDWILDPSNLAPPPAAHALKLKFAEIVPVSTQSILFLEHLQYHPSKPFQTRFSKGIPKKSAQRDAEHLFFACSHAHTRSTYRTRSCGHKHNTDHVNKGTRSHFNRNQFEQILWQNAVVVTCHDRISSTFDSVWPHNTHMDKVRTYRHVSGLGQTYENEGGPRSFALA